MTAGLIVFCSQFFTCSNPLMLTDVQAPVLGTPLVPLFRTQAFYVSVGDCHGHSAQTSQFDNTSSSSQQWQTAMASSEPSREPRARGSHAMPRGRRVTGVCERTTPPEEKTHVGRQAFRMPNQWLDCSFCCGTAGPRLAQKEGIFSVSFTQKEWIFSVSFQF